MTDNLYIEILDEDGLPVREGETGQVIVTELRSRAMPLLRYQLMDYVEVGHERCPCGRGLPLIRQVIGRAYDYLVSRSGRRFHGEKVMYLLERLQGLKMGVRQMQVKQTSISNLTIELLETLIKSLTVLVRMVELDDPISTHLQRAPFPVKRVPRFERPYSAEKGSVATWKPEHQIFWYCFTIEGCLNRPIGQQSLNLRGKDKAAIPDPVIHRFYAHTVPRKEQLLTPLIPNSKRKHAV